MRTDIEICSQRLSSVVQCTAATVQAGGYIVIFFFGKISIPVGNTVTVIVDLTYIIRDSWW